MSRLGMIRVAAGTPVVTVANPLANEAEILKLMAEAEEQKAGILLLPELVITGATAGDLFHQELLYRKQLEVLERIVLSSEGTDLTTVLGFYFRLENNYYNCAALIKGGKILGIVPKMNMPCAYDSADARFFAPGKEIAESYDEVKIFGEYVPFGNIVFCDDESGLSLGIEVGEDFMSPLSPGTHLALNGAHIILNPAAAAETAGSCELRSGLIKAMSAKALCGYVYAGSGAGESTTDLVFGGHHVVAEAGDVIAENDAVLLHGKLTVIEIDYDRIKYDRSHGHVFAETAAYYSDRLMYQTVDVSGLRVCDTGDRLVRNFAKNPFVPSCPELAKKRLGEIFAIQAAAYAKRMKHTHSNKSVIGISGGLDSTLALLVTAQVHRLLGLPAENIVAVTMPGFGTTDTTYNNALTIMKTLGCDVREISIVPSVRQHFADIGHDETIRDLTYENAQARERTQ
ncbi:MAG: NAD(+) synthase, partial [Firmicutes bacterium]|nr:NAD(+) synthase [Bacillota bacterium]